MFCICVYIMYQSVCDFECIIIFAAFEQMRNISLEYSAIVIGRIFL